MICLFVSTQLTNVTDRQTDRHRRTAQAALMHSIARQKCHVTKRENLFLIQINYASNAIDTDSRGRTSSGCTAREKQKPGTQPICGTYLVVRTLSIQLHCNSQHKYCQHLSVSLTRVDWRVTIAWHVLYSWTATATARQLSVLYQRDSTYGRRTNCTNCHSHRTLLIDCVSCNLY